MSRQSLRVVQPNKPDDYLTADDLYASITKAGFLVVRSGKSQEMATYPPGQWTSVHAEPTVGNRP